MNFCLRNSSIAIACIFTIALIMGATSILKAQCFTIGSGNKETDSPGFWQNGGTWVGNSPGCNANNSKIELDVNVISNCGTLYIDEEEQDFQVVNNSYILIYSDLVFGDKICFYVEAGSEVVVVGDIKAYGEKGTIDVDGVLKVYGAIDCGGSCDPGKWNFPGTGIICAVDSCSNGWGGNMVCLNALSPPAVCGAILPIELISFMVHEIPDEQRVNITWITASESNNDYFTVERSRDGQVFEELLQVPGAGNSNQPLSYQAIDDNPYPGLSYYRLKQTDYDGQKEYFDMKSVRVQGTAGQVNIFPNPVNGGRLKVMYNNVGEDEILIVLYNQLGEMLYTNEVEPQNGNITAIIDLPESLMPGLYFIVGRYKDHHTVFTKKLVVQGD